VQLYGCGKKQSAHEPTCTAQGPQVAASVGQAVPLRYVVIYKFHWHLLTPPFLQIFVNNNNQLTTIHLKIELNLNHHHHNAMWKFWAQANNIRPLGPLGLGLRLWLGLNLGLAFLELFTENNENQHLSSR